MDISSTQQADIPIPFADPEKKPQVALLRGLSKGGFMNRYLRGARSMADELGIEVVVFDAGDKEEMLAMAQDLIEQRVDAIIVNHVDLDYLKPALDTALELGIPVVSFDSVGTHPEVPEVEQDDMLTSYLLSRQIAVDYGGKAKVIYVNSVEFAPLLRRDRIWQDIKWRFTGISEVKADMGSVIDDTASIAEKTVDALLQQHPDTNVILAMWDEYAKGAVQAVKNRGLSDQVKVYSVDITGEDIKMMTEPGSPWVSTVAADSLNVGRLALRTAVALIAGESVDRFLFVESYLITQELLTTNEITSMDELIGVLPFLGESRHLWPEWMISILARGGYQKPIAALPAEELVAQLQSTLADLERRNTQLRIAADVSYMIGSILDPVDLMQQIVDAVCDRFDLYFVGLYLVQDGIGSEYLHKMAVLQAGTGEAGKEMVKNWHALQLDSASMIGQCITTGEARIALSITDETERFTNPLLLKTRSELALPFISRNETIGALTIQSPRENAFSQEDITVLQTMAGQIANAIENARLFVETERALEELKEANRRYIRDGWDNYLKRR